MDYRRFLPRWKKANLQTNLRAVERVTAVARAVDATPAQVALAWLLAQGDDVVPIPGTTRVVNLEQNLGSLEVSLSPELLAQLAEVTAIGDRYPTSAGGAGVPGSAKS